MRLCAWLFITNPLRIQPQKILDSENLDWKLCLLINLRVLLPIVTLLHNQNRIRDHMYEQLDCRLIFKWINIFFLFQFVDSTLSQKLFLDIKFVLFRVIYIFLSSFYTFSTFTSFPWANALCECRIFYRRIELLVWCKHFAVIHSRFSKQYNIVHCKKKFGTEFQCTAIQALNETLFISGLKLKTDWCLFKTVIIWHTRPKFSFRVLELKIMKLNINIL